jgi:8-oxo-dGTP pyrophosphatase MutT (NUDIX family)
MSPEGGMTVALITSRGTQRWVLPKGWVKEGLSASETAAAEAREEAGLLGEIAREPMGRYQYRKRLHALASIVCIVDVFRFRVTGRLATWPEQHERSLEFFPPEEAAGLVHEPELARLLLSLHDT